MKYHTFTHPTVGVVVATGLNKQDAFMNAAKMVNTHLGVPTSTCQLGKLKFHKPVVGESFPVLVMK